MKQKKLSEMSREELTNLCRYYKGGNENPYESKEPNKAVLWSYEFGFVNDVLNKSEVLEECAYEYANAGLNDFRANDTIPLALKAYLFHIWQKWSYDGNPEGFKKFFYKNY